MPNRNGGFKRTTAKRFNTKPQKCRVPDGRTTILSSSEVPMSTDVEPNRIRQIKLNTIVR